jgi:lytic murein transglycosylase
MRLTSTLSAALVSVVALFAGTQHAAAAACSNTSAGFEDWSAAFKQQAAAQGFSPRMLDKVFSSVNYSRSTISADRGQKSFKLSFDQFMQKRGGQTIINRGKTMKKNNAALFARLEKRYGVPAGPLIAIWGMETGFGSFLGKEHTLSAVATLAFDCRRSAFFTDQFYAALELVQAGNLDVNAKGAAHGEIGQTQFLPRNVIRFGVDGDGDGHIDMVRSRSDALASTANFLRGHGWQPSAGYQQGEPNFVAIEGWNAAKVYQQAIAYIGAQIDAE